MAKFYFIVALMILQGLPFSYATLSEGICPTPTTVTSTPGSSVVIKPGPKVYLNLIVTTNCSGENLQALNDSLQIDIKAVYTCAGFPIKTVKTLSISCNSSLSITLDLWFCSGLPANKTIEEVFQDALNNGNISSLTENNTHYTFTFVGSTAVTTGEATPTVGGTVTTAMGGGTVTTAMDGGTVTTAMGGGTITTAMDGGTVTTAMDGGTVTTAMGGGGGGGTVTTTAAGGGGGGGTTITTVAGGGGGGATVTTAAGMTTTTVTGGISPTSTPSSSVVIKKPGPKVYLNLIVTTNCGGENLQALNDSLQIDIKAVYTNAGFLIKTVITLSISCNSPALTITLDLSFYSGLPTGKTIKEVFQDALKKGNISSLTESNTEYTFTFVGVELKYSPKEGECQKVCCDGGGGELTVVLIKCTPVNNTCEGFENDEKKEDGHCPGDSLGTCSETCDDDDSGSHHNTPSFAVIILLVLAKTIFC